MSERNNASARPAEPLGSRLLGRVAPVVFATLDRELLVGRGR